MQPIEQLSHILPTLSALVDRIDPMQLGDPTPCDEFTVHDVLDHMIVLGGSFAPMFRGEEPPELTPPPVYGVVPTAQFRATMDDLLAALRSEGAMERTISAPFGAVPGDTFARFVAFDGLVHGWDLATAAGLPYDPPADVIDAVDEFARAAISPEMRGGGAFEDPTVPPQTASRLERLVAFSGRSV
jgi:uncharacterized protein (TIGR03086 family)